MKTYLQPVVFSFLILTVCCGVQADTLLWNNSGYTGFEFPQYPEAYVEMLDYGTTTGGRISKFVFSYSSYYSVAAWVKFYTATDRFDIGWATRSFSMLLPNTNGYAQTYEYVIPEASRFQMPSGSFGYSFIFSDSSTRVTLATGGTGIDQYLWIWDDWYNDFMRGDLGAAYNFYFKLYTSPPIDSITCDIKGYKFNDLNGNGVWDGAEPALAGWDIYLDTNNDSVHQSTEPNVVTDPNGMYMFENYASPATYRVREIIKDGWTQTLPGASGNYQYLLNTEPNHVYGPYNFGNKVGSGTTVRLSAIEDTYARSNQPDTNFGSSDGITAGMESTTEYQAFIKFDLSSIPQGQVITSAKLLLDGSFVTIPAPLLAAFRIPDNWTESTLTWNNKPAAYDTNPIDQKTAVIDITSWAVTLDVDKDYATQTPYSVLITKAASSPSNTRAVFWSKDFIIPDFKPVLEVTYEPIFGGGKGTDSEPFLIYTGQQMNQIGLYPHRWHMSYKLMADVSLSAYTGTAYNRIGLASMTSGLGYFYGVFDGNYHTVSGFSYSASSTDNIGLFGYVYNGTIRNLGIISPSIVNLGSTNYVGALAGFMNSSDVSGCWVQGGSVAGGTYVGGLVGSAALSCIAECDSSASVSGGNYVGGLIGSHPSPPAVSWIRDCYASGSVSGTSYVGGFIGRSSDLLIHNCYSRGLVTAASNVGGFSGYNSNWLIEGQNVFSCFWDTLTSGKPTSAAGTGQTTAQMKTLGTFTGAGWDFVTETVNGVSDTWGLPASSYPVLWRQLATPPALPTFAGGSGTAATPYLISTAAQLNSIGHNPRLMDKHFRLTQDIDLNGGAYWVIGERPRSFTGTFDGNNHSIHNLNIESGDLISCLGLFGSMRGTNSALRNLTLVDAVVSGSQTLTAGAFAGRVYGATLENCHVKNSVVTGFYTTGGLVGETYFFGKILNCSVMGGSVSTPATDTIYGVGGLVGENSYGSSIEDSFAWTDVAGKVHVGGLVGYNRVSSPVNNCYSKGSVTGTETRIGGLVGSCASSGNLTKCYTNASVSGPAGQQVGALVGYLNGGTHTGCFWDNTVNPSLPGLGYTGGTPMLDVTGLPTASLQMQTTFTAKGWDFGDVWRICEATNYPRLRWEPLSKGDFVCPEGVELADVLFMADQWLVIGASSADIAPSTPDSKVNLKDFAMLAGNWLEGTD
ncbi:MAG: DNRLRE domain-containing protein [Planctomycetaceae bacterium]|nr:DNRLRE domain-containing protein [Planctomycetaceae bacterium]